MVWALLTSSTLTACDGDDEGATVPMMDASVEMDASMMDASESMDAAAPLTSADLPNLWAQAICAPADGCFGELTQFFINTSDCITHYEGLFRAYLLPSIESAERNGLTTFDPDAVDACMQVVSTRPCDQFLNVQRFAACDALFEGVTPLGGDCSSDLECAGSAYCDMSAGACPGTCAEKGAENAACSGDESCESDLVCAGGTCKGRPATLTGTECINEGAFCGYGLICLNDGGTGATCQPASALTRIPEGELCDIEGLRLCEEGLSCAASPPVDMPELRCVKPVASGQVCQFGFPEACPSGEYCYENDDASPLEGVCVPRPGDGDPCGEVVLNPGLGPVCSLGLSCIAGICRQRADAGDPCIADEQCYGDNCVDDAASPTGLSCAEVPLCTPDA